MDRAAQLGADAVVETERLLLRPLTPADRGDLCEILQDKETMYAYEHAFSDEEVDQWLQNQLRRYREEGFGLWAAARGGVSPEAPLLGDGLRHRGCPRVHGLRL